MSFLLQQTISRQMVILTVERKINGELVVDRIAKIMDDYKQYQGPCRAICYCLTRKACEYYKLAFIKKGVKAEVFVRTGEGGACKQSDSEKHEILKMFHQGTIQVICATKALGRGVHINCPVRFIFHPVMPTSLTGKQAAALKAGRVVSCGRTHTTLIP